MILLTVKELAERLRVSLATAYKLVNRSKIAFVKVEGCIRIRDCDLDTYLANGLQPVTIDSSQEVSRAKIQLRHIKLKK